MMTIYVGNLPFSTTENDVQKMFESYGAVRRVTLMRDGEGGRSRGFGFVEMGDDVAASAALEALQGSDHGGRPLKVSPARVKTRRPTGGGRGFGGGGGGRGGFGGGGGGRSYN